MCLSLWLVCQSISEPFCLTVFQSGNVDNVTLDLHPQQAGFPLYSFFFLLDVQAPLFDSNDLLALALYDNTQFPMYEVREIPQSIKRCF